MANNNTSKINFQNFYTMCIQFFEKVKLIILNNRAKVDRDFNRINKDV